MMEKNWVRFAGIRTPQQNDVSFLDFTIRAGSSARSENRRQTGDAGSVSSSVTAINIVGAHDAADEFLCGVIYFVDSLRAAEHAEVAVVILGHRLTEGYGNAVQGFIPGGGTM
jgi:hypothetical protein